MNRPPWWKQQRAHLIVSTARCVVKLSNLVHPCQNSIFSGLKKTRSVSLYIKNDSHFNVINNNPNTILMFGYLRRSIKLFTCIGQTSSYVCLFVPNNVFACLYGTTCLLVCTEKKSHSQIPKLYIFSCIYGDAGAIIIHNQIIHLFLYPQRREARIQRVRLQRAKR